MAALKLRKFGSHEEAELFLRGGIQSGPLPASGPTGDTVIYGLDGLTLVFTTPAITVTFTQTGGSQAPTTLASIITQINTALTGHTARLVNRSLRITKDAPAAIVLAGSGTANAKLGFGEGGVTSKKYAAPTDSAPRLISIGTFGPSEAVVLVVTEE